MQILSKLVQFLSNLDVFWRLLPPNFQKYCPCYMIFSSRKHHKDKNNICKNKNHQPIIHAVFLLLWAFYKSNLPTKDEEIPWILSFEILVLGQLLMRAEKQTSFRNLVETEILTLYSKFGRVPDKPKHHLYQSSPSCVSLM